MARTRELKIFSAVLKRGGHEEHELEEHELKK